MTTVTATKLHEQVLDAQLRRLFSEKETGLEIKEKTFVDEFQIVEFLGEGREGEVYRVRNNEHTYIAKKVSCHLESTEGRDVEKQIQALQRLSHSNIPGYIDCLVEDEVGFRKRNYFLITEDVKGENLMEYQNRKGVIPTEELEDICEQTLGALAHAHSKGVLHRDVKPENLIITEDGQVKVIDWGVAKIEGAQTRMSTLGVVGTAGYMAPEVLMGEKATNKSDIYSLGATIIAAARGKDHGGFDSSFEMKQYLLDLELGNLSSVLDSMTEMNPEDRKWEVAEGKYVSEKTIEKEAIPKASDYGKYLLRWVVAPAVLAGGLLAVPHAFRYEDNVGITSVSTRKVLKDSGEKVLETQQWADDIIKAKELFGGQIVYKNNHSVFEWKWPSETRELQRRLREYRDSGIQVKVKSYGIPGFRKNIVSVHPVGQEKWEPILRQTYEAEIRTGHGLSVRFQYRLVDPAKAEGEITDKPEYFRDVVKSVVANRLNKLRLDELTENYLNIGRAINEITSEFGVVAAVKSHGAIEQKPSEGQGEWEGWQVYDMSRTGYHQLEKARTEALQTRYTDVDGDEREDFMYVRGKKASPSLEGEFAEEAFLSGYQDKAKELVEQLEGVKDLEFTGSNCMARKRRGVKTLRDVRDEMVIAHRSGQELSDEPMQRYLAMSGEVSNKFAEVSEVVEGACKNK